MIEALASVFCWSRACVDTSASPSFLQRIASRPRCKANSTKIQRRRQREVGVPHRTYSPASSAIVLQPIMMNEHVMCLNIRNMMQRAVVNLHKSGVGL